MFGIPVALEAFKASKEVLVRRPAPPGIRPFLENKRSIQGEISLCWLCVNIVQVKRRQFLETEIKHLCLSRVFQTWPGALSHFDSIPEFFLPPRFKNSEISKTNSAESHQKSRFVYFFSREISGALCSVFACEIPILHSPDFLPCLSYYYS